MAKNRRSRRIEKIASGGLRTELSQGMVMTASGQVGQNKQEWFGPGNTLTPVAQEQAKGRTQDFPFAINTTINKPKTNEGISMQELRQIADAYDLLRLVIETRKDQISKLDWQIMKKDGNTDARCEKLVSFFQSPDKELDWDGWLRVILEDLLVLDAVAIYPQKTLGGDVYSLDVVDSATVKRVIDARGKTPIAPAPAYQQILKGLPAVDYTREELIYSRRNARSNRIYGYSPVEQVVMTVNIAMRRQLHQLEYYTSGSIPDAIISVPSEWNPDQIAAFQAFWDAVHEGDSAARRHLRMVPGGANIHQTKEPVIKDMYDEWLSRIVCFAFSISPQALIAHMNRATAESSAEQAILEGMQPIMTYLENLMNRIIRDVFGYSDIEFKWKSERETDPYVQAQIDEIYVNTGVMKVNEVRNRLGLNALSEKEEQTAETSDMAVVANSNKDR